MEKSFSLIACDGPFCVLANAPVNTDSLWIRVIAFLFVLGLCAFFITRFNKKRLSVSAVRGDGKIRIGEIFDKSKIKSANLKQKKQTTRMIKISCTNWNNCKGATEKSKKNYEGLIFRMSSNALLKIIKSNTEIKCPVCFSEVKYDKYSLPLSSNGETIIYQKRID